MILIDQAARALFEEANRQYPVLGFGYDDCGNGTTVLDGSYDLKAIVRAVLAALREPTAAMKEAGAFADLSHSNGGDDNSFDYLSEDGAGQVWQKMIDAALTEHPVTVQN